MVEASQINAKVVIGVAIDKSLATNLLCLQCSFFLMRIRLNLGLSFIYENYLLKLVKMTNCEKLLSLYFASRMTLDVLVLKLVLLNPCSEQVSTKSSSIVLWSM